MKARILKYLIAGLVFCSFNLWLSVEYHRNTGMHSIIGSDARGYYEYLPYFFIFKDVKHQYYSYHLENGNTFNKYTCGVAILQTPFFFSIYGINCMAGRDTGGYSDSYGFGIALATTIYLYLGLLFCFFFLRRVFTLRTTWISLFLLYFGTNLFYYAFAEPGASHVYSFFCFAGFVFAVQRFYQKPGFYSNLLCALFFAMALLIRQTNAFLLLFLLLYDIRNLAELRGRVIFFFRNYTFIITYAVCIFILFIPQMLYWKAVVDQYLVFAYKYSYSDESFLYWKHPKIKEVLFASSCSWLPYTPLMGLSMVGLFYLAVKRQFQGQAILPVFLLALYACASWWAYNFSCAFGYRPFVEYYALLCIPLAYVVERILNRSGKTFLKVSFMIVLLCGIYINIEMTWAFQYDTWCAPEWSYGKYMQMIRSFF